MALEKRLVVYGRLNLSGPELDVLLGSRGFQAYPVETEDELLDILRYSQPDVAVLVGAPGFASLSRMLAASQDGAHSLMVVVWPQVSPTDAASLLEMGVDFVSSSYHPDWLAAQIRASLRRIGTERAAPTVIDLGYLHIDLQDRRVTVNEREVPLTRTEFSVLRVLAERPGTVLPSGEIMQQVIGVRLDEPQAQDLLKVHIHRLRQKLEQDPNNPRFIKTVRGHGYMYAFERRAKPRAASSLPDAG